MIPRPTRITRGSARGLAYGTLPREVDERLAAWLAEGRVTEGTALKPGSVFRFGAWAVKLFEPATGWRRLRRSRALHSAELARRILPILSPRPLVALEERRGARRGRGLLVSELVEGPHLHEAWDDPEALGELPAFMARCHRRRVFHGDLHPRNLIWNGSDWVLIDLESVRHVLHGLFAPNLVRNQWSRLYRNMVQFRPEAGPRMRELFESYLRITGRGGNPDDQWARVVAGAGSAAPSGAEARVAAPQSEK